ncbi:DUF3164 family protein [Telmatospirillum sp. J64-1]|uniref:DUF3164 family protein n=1 Tax=Telmatospirillum sp. J64-1 TaxID=2502183 RepID=UPI002106E721|nr:DUF3164 family protein [Telmatospirillum sp. J64-1]
MMSETIGMAREGYMRNALGHDVPLELVRPLDKLRDELVRGLIMKAKDLRDQMRNFKADALSEISAFVDLAAAEYDTKLGGLKGNLTLRSYDGTIEIKVQVAEHLRFDERLKVAEKLVGDCLTEWAADARPELKAIVERAFRTDKDGNVSTSAVLGLRRLEITDDRWKRAMEAIAAAMLVTGTKSYVRFYERPSAEMPLQAVSLDLAVL